MAYQVFYCFIVSTIDHELFFEDDKDCYHYNGSGRCVSSLKSESSKSQMQFGDGEKVKLFTFIIKSVGRLYL